MMTWTSDEIRRLRCLFAIYYPTRTDAARAARDADLNTAEIDFSGSAINRWHSILEYAGPRNKIESLLDIATTDNPSVEELRLARDGHIPPGFREPKVDWKGSDDNLKIEQIIGTQSTLVPVSYLEIGTIRARAVARIRLPNGSSGSGFLTSHNVIITNNHVLPSVELTRSAIVQFNYQKSPNGMDNPVDEYNLIPDDMFCTSVEDDWTAVRIAGNPNAIWGSLSVTQSAVPATGDRVNIIQHPGGGPKQVSCLANVVVYVGGGRLQYLTDTLPGSSGSPVFDRDWNVVAVHHASLTSNASSNNTYLRNEGILIDRVVAGLATL
ncbi:serine protease [Bradyrhizobium sp. ORS 375]|uniref:trypsin-like serine peptidase n=1 Tax=Bradyrhizobium sp. (strain ORS 375) TaxID=566679 RepID=UPI0005506BC3|nr:serine protease [Bradyrhizobium sp. ORS 375]